METIYSPPTYRINKEYPVYIGSNILNELNSKIKPYKPNKVIIVTEDNVNKIYGKKVLELIKKDFQADLISIVPGEKNKTPETYLKLCNDILSKNVSKKSFILLLGGGVLGNIGGFAASTIMRGIKFAYIPTTIMSQSDSTTGGKQGVNTKAGKNLLGLFNDPEFVFIEIDFLKTLSLREISCGLSECIKHALCQDKEFFEYLKRTISSNDEYSLTDLQKIIKKTIELKMNILKIDPKEINEGKILVYGHTIGHAVETLANGKLNHGESISIGMVCAAELSKLLGYCNDEFVKTHKEILEKAGLPVKIPKDISRESIIKQLDYDKKYGYGKEFVLLMNIGQIASIEGKIGIEVKQEIIEKVLDLCY